MTEHPRPTDATIKFLYAHAFRCGFNGCRRPLYRVDDHTGERTLNSRVCHIRARSAGGPRWDPQQSENDNRSEKNLIVMCVEHASVFDDRLTWMSYPATMICEWKAQQLSDYDSIQQGWIIDDKMTRNVAAASFSQVDVAINELTISLGGEGGRAPGSGGGGGGAIGRNARGGRGGDGGEVRMDNGDFTTSLVADASDLSCHALSEPTAFSDVPAPGAGGGGAGAIGDNSRGGDGGGGGEHVTGVFDLVALRNVGLDRIEVEVGKGGVGPALPGQHGLDGEDTVLRFVKLDGTVLREVRAKGGVAGRSQGSIFPDDAVEISIADINGGFRISSVMAVNGVEIRDGLFYVLGGDWKTLIVPMLPFDVVFPVAFSARWQSLNGQTPRGLILSLKSPLGREVSSQNAIVPRDGLHQCYRQWVCPIGARLDSEGLWTVAIRSGEFVLATTDFRVSVLEPT